MGDKTSPSNVDAVVGSVVDIRFELYASGVNGATPERVEMKRVRQLLGCTTNG